MPQLCPGIGGGGTTHFLGGGGHAKKFNFRSLCPQLQNRVGAYAGKIPRCGARKLVACPDQLNSLDIPKSGVAQTAVGDRNLLALPYIFISIKSDWHSISSGGGSQTSRAIGLLYGLEVCALNKTEITLLDFVINRRFFVKLFQTNNIEIVRACQERSSSVLNYQDCSIVQAR